jgi:predicted DNA-binding transcriptional regulator AlpA
VTDDDDTLINRATLIDWLGIDRSTAMRWQRKGFGPRPIKLGKNLVRYRRGDVRAFLASREVPPQFTPKVG